MTDAADTLADERANDLAGFLRDWLAEESLPGASVAVVRGGETVYADGFGARDLAANEPATPETRYGVGSVTKSFAALAVLQLADRGDLAVEDALGDHLPDAPDAVADVSLHHLLSHSSGLANLGVSEALIARRADLGEAGVPLSDRADFRAHVAGAADERAGDPGESFRYCNAGYTLVGEVVAEVSGRPFTEYVEAEILAPLGMDRSTFDPRGRNVATPYWVGDGDPDPADYPTRDLSAAPGGLVAPVTELATYVAANAAGGRAGGTRLVDPDLLARAHAGHVETPAGPYGYGWRRRDALDRTVVGHSGSIGVSTAYVGFTADGEWGVALGCNAAPGYALAHVGLGALAVALGRDPDALSFFARRRRFERLVGTYESYRGVRRATVERRGEVLALRFEDAFGGEPTTLVPADPRAEEFFAVTPDGRRRRVEVAGDDDGVTVDYGRWRLHEVD